MPRPEVSESRVVSLSSCSCLGYYLLITYISSACESTLCLKKVPTFKLSVTLSHLNRFSKFFHCWKAYEICYKTHMTSPTSP